MKIFFLEICRYWKSSKTINSIQVCCPSLINIANCNRVLATESTTIAELSSELVRYRIVNPRTHTPLDWPGNLLHKLRELGPSLLGIDSRTRTIWERSWEPLFQGRHMRPPSEPARNRCSPWVQVALRFLRRRSLNRSLERRNTNFVAWLSKRSE